jgi:hypothetical protein
LLQLSQWHYSYDHASSAYEISKDSNGVFAGSLTLPLNVINGINSNVFVRLKATSTTGTVTGTIQNTVAGLSKTVSLSATVAAPTLAVNPATLSGFVTTVNQASLTKSYNLVAANLASGSNSNRNCSGRLRNKCAGNQYFFK